MNKNSGEGNIGSSPFGAVMSSHKANDGNEQLSKNLESKSDKTEKTAENKGRAEASKGMEDHSSKVAAVVLEKRATRKSGVTGKFAEKGKPGLASADSLLPLEEPIKAAVRRLDTAYKAVTDMVKETGKFLKGMGDGEVEYVKELGDSLNVAGEYYGRALSGKVNLAADIKEFSSAIGQTLGTAGDYYFKQLPRGKANLRKDIGEVSKAAGDHWNSLDTEHKGKFFGKEVVPILVPGAVGMVAKDAKAANLTGKAGQAITAFAGSEKLAEMEQKFASLQSKLQQMQELAKPLKPATDTRTGGPNIPENPAMNDNVMAMSNEADGLGGESRGFKGRGMDSTGKALSFSDESGIELGTVRQGQDKVWEQAPFPRGDDVHVVLGENLPAGTKTIDRVVFRDGIAEGQKSIDLTADTYASPNKLESKLRGYVHDMQIYDGQPKMRMCFRMKKYEIDEKILHIGIKDSSITAEQKTVFEKVGKEVQAYNKNLQPGIAPLKLKVTVVK